MESYVSWYFSSVTQKKEKLTLPESYEKYQCSLKLSETFIKFVFNVTEIILQTNKNIIRKYFIIFSYLYTFYLKTI